MNLSKEEVFKRIKEPAEERGTKAVFFENLFDKEDLPTWDEFFEHLSDSLVRDKDLNRESGLQEFETMYGGTVRKGQYYSMSEITFEDVYRKNRFSGLLPLEEMFNELEGGPKLYISDAFLSMITGDDYAHHHTDIYTHNFFVNCQGQVRWNIYDSFQYDAEPVETYLLNPGDAIFVKGDVIHEVAVPKPRASVVFRIENIPHYKD